MNTQKVLTYKQKIWFVVMINLLIPLGGISTDIYLPSLPAMSMHFHVSKVLVQLTVSSYVFALGFCQLIAGPISDAVGRKKILLASTLIQLIAIFAILTSSHITLIMLYRFIQGLGAAMMMVPLRAVLNDLFTGKAFKKQFNYLTISFAMGPILGPFIGGYLQHSFGWQACFYFIFIYALLAMVLILFFYRETIAETRAFSIDHLWKHYHVILSNKFFLSSALFMGVIWGYIAVFNVAGPFLIQGVLHKNAVTYGHIAFLMGIAWFLGNVLNRILFRVNLTLKTQVALYVSLAMSIVMLVMNLNGYFTTTLIVAPTFIITMCSANMFPLYIAECIALFPKISASANACVFSLAWVIFGIFTMIASLLKVHSLLPIILTYLSIGILAIVIYYGFIRALTPSHQS